MTGDCIRDPRAERRVGILVQVQREGQNMKIAILDDYQQIAKQSADWGSLPAGTQVDSFADNIADHDALVRRLQPYDVIIAMRERTRFPAALIDALPNLRLLVGTGGRNPSIDSEACARARSRCAALTAAAPLTGRRRVAGRWCARVKSIPQSEKAMRYGACRERDHGVVWPASAASWPGPHRKVLAKYGPAFDMNVVA